MLDVCAESGWLAVSIRLVNLMQMVMQGRWLSDSPLTTLPHIEPYVTPALHSKQSLRSLPSAVHLAQQPYGKVMHHFLPELDEGQIDQVRISRRFQISQRFVSKRHRRPRMFRQASSHGFRGRLIIHKNRNLLNFLTTIEKLAN